MATVEQVADYFIDTSIKWKEDYVTNLRLQKLVYYAQAWFIQRHNKPLFKDDLKKYQFGPVCEKLYRKYAGYGDQPIITTSPSYSINVFTAEELETLNDVMYEYGKYSTPALVNRSHRSSEPWSKIQTEYGIITPAMMKEDFDKLPPLKHMADDADLFSNIPVTDSIPDDWEW